MLISGRYNFLKATANGGYVTNANGYDIGFYSDAGLTSKLNWETELYTATTGQVIYWVQIPTLSASVDTTIYLAYGDSTITTFQSVANRVWDSNYQGVWHLPDGTSLTANDSTANAQNLTITSATAAAGQIDGAAAFSGSTQYISKNSYTTATSTFTISSWVYWTSGNLYAWSMGNDAVGGKFFPLLTHGVGTGSTNHFHFEMGSGTNIINSTTVPVTNTWYHVVITADATTFTMYINGASEGTVAQGTSALTTGYPISLGSYVNPAYNIFNNYWIGSLDNFYQTSNTKSADWVKAEYNNQSAPATFYNIGNGVGIENGNYKNVTVGDGMSTTGGTS